MMQPSDRARIDLENIMALLLAAEEALRPAHLRTVCRMRTRDEREIADLIAEARVALAGARTGLATWHPNGRENHE